MILQVKKLHDDAIIPSYKHEGDSGIDLHSIEDVKIWPNQRRLIKTGLAIKFNRGFDAQVRSRSGLALKKGVFVLNSPGTVDSTI